MSNLVSIKSCIDSLPPATTYQPKYMSVSLSVSVQITKSNEPVPTLEANNNLSPVSNASSHSDQTTTPSSSSNPQDTSPLRQPACAHPSGSLESPPDSFASSNEQDSSSVPPATQSPPDSASLVALPSPAIISFLHPYITSPPSHSPPAPPSRHNDHTGDFLREFHHKIRTNHLTARWDAFRNNQSCTVKRPPCVKGYKRFCKEIGGEFLEFLQQREFRGQGTRTRCECECPPKMM